MLRRVTAGLVCAQGIAPFGDDICLLAFMLGQAGAAKDAAAGEGAGNAAADSPPSEAQRPEVLGAAPKYTVHAPLNLATRPCACYSLLAAAVWASDGAHANAMGT